MGGGSFAIKDKITGIMAMPCRRPRLATRHTVLAKETIIYTGTKNNGIMQRSVEKDA